MQQDQAKRLGRWLREQRQAAGISKRELARRADMTDGTIVRIEQGAFDAPSPHKLARIAEALKLSLADVYSMAGYATPDDLPSFQPYLRRKYRDMPPGAVADLETAFRRIASKHGYEPKGPAPGEDEAPHPDELFD
ncbi:MAG TPA: helix-turn-helix domain-containing protein [Gaiellaceae bacterium]